MWRAIGLALAPGGTGPRVVVSGRGCVRVRMSASERENEARVRTWLNAGTSVCVSKCGQVHAHVRVCVSVCVSALSPVAPPAGHLAPIERDSETAVTRAARSLATARAAPAAVPEGPSLQGPPLHSHAQGHALPPMCTRTDTHKLSPVPWHTAAATLTTAADQLPCGPVWGRSPHLRRGPTAGGASTSRNPKGLSLWERAASAHPLCPHPAPQSPVT